MGLQIEIELQRIHPGFTEDAESAPGNMPGQHRRDLLFWTPRAAATRRNLQRGIFSPAQALSLAPKTAPVSAKRGHGCNAGALLDRSNCFTEPADARAPRWIIFHGEENRRKFARNSADIEIIRSGGHRNRTRISPLRIPGQRRHAPDPANEEDRANGFDRRDWTGEAADFRTARAPLCRANQARGSAQ